MRTEPHGVVTNGVFEFQGARVKALQQGVGSAFLLGRKKRYRQS